jgi:chitin disaccharide deacetylase
VLSSELLGYSLAARVLIINADDFGMYPSVNNAVMQSIENGIASSCNPTHLDWHALADGGREDIFDLGRALAEEYRLAARVWLERGRRMAWQQGLPVVDHDFLDSFSLDLDAKASRYLQLLHELPAGLSEWAVHPGQGDPASRKIDNGWRVRHTDLEFLISAEAREAVRREGIMIIGYRAIKDAWSRQWPQEQAAR